MQFIPVPILFLKHFFPTLFYDVPSALAIPTEFENGTPITVILSFLFKSALCNLVALYITEEAPHIPTPL